MSNIIASHQQAVDTQRVSPNRIRLLQRLSRPHTHVERLQAIEEALNGGMSLNEIEEVLDWLDQ